MTTLLNRLGNLGLLVVACALLLGGLAGAAVAHHFDRLSSNTTATQPHQPGKAPAKPKHQNPNQKNNDGDHQDGTSGNNTSESD